MHRTRKLELILTLVILLELLGLKLAYGTTVSGDANGTAVRRGNFIIAAFTDGTLCYGTREPREATCHHAIPVHASYKEIQGEK